MFRTEAEFVRWLCEQVQIHSRNLHLGIGDDAALVKAVASSDLVLKADMSIENVHFSERLHPPRAVGHRALARSISDIAAMGATPRFALVSLALSQRVTRAWVSQFYAGLLALAARLKVTVAGGDTAWVDGNTLIDVIVVGEVHRGQALRRSGAKPGDQVFVSGRLGLSALGFETIKRSAQTSPRRETASRGTRQPASTPLDVATKHHLYPEPRTTLGRYLSGNRLASAAIDISDGLSTDLSHLCEASGVGARVWEDRIPRPRAPGLTREDMLRFAVHGGEDYELLFTVPAKKSARLPREIAGVALHLIGEVASSKQILLVNPGGDETVLRPSGYDHFRKRFQSV